MIIGGSFVFQLWGLIFGLGHFRGGMEAYILNFTAWTLKRSTGLA